jgi:hypothetical protein
MAATHTFNADVEAGCATQALPPKETKVYYMAWLMKSLPEFAIFRRFGWLSALHLMGLQAELAKLEDDLQHCLVFDEEDPKDPSQGPPSSTNLGVLTHAPESRQRKLMEESMAKLQEYSKHVLMYCLSP